LTRVNGLSPNETIHETHLDVEPNLGTTMIACKRLQINCLFQTDLLLFPKMQDKLYIPVIWLEESGGISEDLANQFKSSVYFAQHLSIILKYSAFSVGILFGIFALVGGIRTYQKRQVPTRYVPINEVFTK